MIDLSIIIVNYKTKDLLRDCLKSIYKETSDIVFEVIVIDNASHDGSCEMIRQEYSSIVLIENSQNLGFSAANNQGLKIARGQYLLLLNSDTVILEKAINKVVAFMDKDISVSIVGCKHLYPSGQLQPSCRGFMTPWNVFTEATFLYLLLKSTKLFGSYYMSYFQYDRIAQVDVVMGSFLLFRREVLEKIGLLDERFYFYSEETDFCFRAAKSGLKTYFYPFASIIHIGGGSTKNSLWMFDYLHKSQYQFIEKHYSGKNNRVLKIIKRFGIIIRIPVYFIGSIVTLNKNMLKKCVIHCRLAVKKY